MEISFFTTTKRISNGEALDLCFLLWMFEWIHNLWIIFSWIQINTQVYFKFIHTFLATVFWVFKSMNIRVVVNKALLVYYWALALRVLSDWLCLWGLLTTGVYSCTCSADESIKCMFLAGLATATNHRLATPRLQQLKESPLQTDGLNCVMNQISLQCLQYYTTSINVFLVSREHQMVTIKWQSFKNHWQSHHLSTHVYSFSQQPWRIRLLPAMQPQSHQQQQWVYVSIWRNIINKYINCRQSTDNHHIMTIELNRW